MREPPFPYSGKAFPCRRNYGELCTNGDDAAREVIRAPFRGLRVPGRSGMDAERHTMRRTLTAVATIGLLGALAACAPGPVASPSGGGNGAAPSGGTIDYSTFKGKKITYLYFTDGPDEAATRALLKEFEAKRAPRCSEWLTAIVTSLSLRSWGHDRA